MFSKAVTVYFDKTKAYNSKPLYDAFAYEIDLVVDELHIEDIQLTDGYESRDDAEWTDITFMANGHFVSLSSPHYNNKYQAPYVTGVIYEKGYTRNDIINDTGGAFDLFDTYVPLKKLVTQGKIYPYMIVEWLSKYVIKNESK